MPVQEEPHIKPRLPLSLPWVLVLGFIVLSALFFVPVPKELRNAVGGAVLNTGHIIFFCMFALAFYPFTKGRNRTRLPRFLLIVFALSLLVETIQSSVGRAFQWEDILRNELGAILGISIQMHFQRPHKAHWALRISLLVAITVVILVERMPLYEKLLSLYNPS
jgi:glycopeptide antibiotics resistance protein